MGRLNEAKSALRGAACGPEAGAGGGSGSRGPCSSLLSASRVLTASPRHDFGDKSRELVSLWFSRSLRNKALSRARNASSGDCCFFILRRALKSA